MRYWRVAAVGLISSALIGWSAPAARAEVSYHGSAWFWGSPRPQGLDLLDVDFAGDRGYAAGVEGTLLRSDDGGLSWTGLEPPTGEDLVAVEAPAADAVVVVAGCRGLLRSDDGGRTFVRLQSRAAGCVADVEFVSSDIGYVLLEDRTVLRTVDGGRTFVRGSPLPATGDPSPAVALDMVDGSTGFASTSGPFGPGAIFRTRDAGGSWQKVAESGSGAGDVEAAGGAVYALVGGALLRSANDGDDWTSRPLADMRADLRPRALTCLDALRCLLTAADGHDQRVLLRTDDGGATATEVPGGTGVDAADPASASRVVAVGDLGVTIVSDDGGRTFSPVGGGWGPLVDRPLVLLRPSTAFAQAPFDDSGHDSGYDLVRSVDAGRTWAPVDIPLGRRDFLRDYSFSSRRTGVALVLTAGRGGDVRDPRLLGTVDGGASWELLRRVRLRSTEALLALPRRRVLAGGSTGLSLSLDGGRHFRPIASARGLPLTSLDRGRRVVAAYGARAAMLSTTRGRTWRRIALPPGRVARLEFVDRQVGYLVSRAGPVFKTANGGRAWRRLLGAGPRPASDLAFADRRNGHLDVSVPRRDVDPDLFGDDSSVATVLRTSDGGRTWRPQLEVRGSRVRAIGAFGPDRAVAATGGDLIWTATGGDGASATRLRIVAHRRREGTVVTGRLTPAHAGDRVLVGVVSGADWASRRVTVNLDGRFAARFHRRAAFALAQWTGDAGRRGAGTPAVRVTRAGRTSRAAATASPSLPFAGGWWWGNPLPQGNDLAAIDMAGQEGFAGTGGNVLRTRDGGATWAPAELDDRIDTVRFADADTLIGLGSCGEVFRSDDHGASFTRLAYRPPPGRNCAAELAVVDFPADQVGYVLGGGSLYRTDDGGASFALRTPVSARELVFTSTEVGFALDTKAIFRTSDGGRSWTRVASGNDELGDIEFTDASHGFAAGSRTLLRTADGGATWERAPLGGAPPGLVLRDIRCADRKTCLIAGETPPDRTFPDRGVIDSGLLRTTDAGDTVQRVSSERVLALDYSTPTRVVAVGRRGLTLLSDDGGSSFRELSHGSQDSYTLISAASARVLYAVGGRSGLARSSDGGRRWQPLELPLPDDSSVDQVSFLDGQAGLVVARDRQGPRRHAHLLGTSDGGASWQVLRSARARTLRAAAPLGGARILAVGREAFRLSSDSGRTLKPIRSPALRGLRPGGIDLGRGCAVAYGLRGLALSTDRGRTWRRIPPPRGRMVIRADFVDPRTGFIATGFGAAVYRTDDGGRTWRRLHGVGSHRVFGVSFADRRHGFLASQLLAQADPPKPVEAMEGSYLLRTSDGGRTWRPQTRVHAESLALALGAKGGVLLSNGDLAWTATGGDPPRRTSLTTNVRVRDKKPKGFVVTGRLTPARRGDRILVTLRGSGSEHVRAPAVGADGRYRTVFGPTRDGHVVAQWPGDAERAAAATPAMRVPVGGGRR